jgi:predicted transcriptional regulator
MGTTQTAISQYLSAKRALKGLEQVEEYLPKIQVMAQETAQKLAGGEIGVGAITPDFCRLCSSFCRRGVEAQGPLPEYFI